MKANSEIRALTGLRGLAATLVAAYHINPELSAQSLPYVGAVNGRGYLWVDLFFMLSGFVLALNDGDRFAEGMSLTHWGDFLTRRFARIYPLYFAVILASGAIVLAGAGKSFGVPSLETNLHHPDALVLANPMMMQSWGIGPSIDGAAWSLSTEWAAYLIFPILVLQVLFARKRAVIVVAAAAVCAVILSAALVAWDGEIHSGPLDAYDGATAEPLLRCLGGFALGMVTYRIASTDIADWLANDVVIGGALALLFASLACGVPDLLVLPLFSLLIAGLYKNRGMTGKIIGCKLLYALGVISYSVYLVHPFFVTPKAQLVQSHQGSVTSDIVVSIAVYATLIVISFITYASIEKPGRRAITRTIRACSIREKLGKVIPIKAT